MKKNRIKLQVIVSAFIFTQIQSQLFSAPPKYSTKPSQPVAGNLAIPKPKIDGFLDMSYIFNLNGPASQRTLTHSFDRKNNIFLLNALQINVDGAAQAGLGYHGELAFGTDPSHYKASGTNSQAEFGLPTAQTNLSYNLDVQELYLTYAGEQHPLSFKIGKFEKLCGIEQIESWKNPTITRGIIFARALPYTHVGVFAGYQVNPLINFGLGIVNGWNMNTDNNGAKTFATKIALGFSETLQGNITLYAGPEKNANSGDTRTTIDTDWILKPRETTTVKFEFLFGQERNSSIADKNSNGVADGGDANWYALSLQGVEQMSDRFFIGGRYEWFYDKDGARLVAPFFAALNGVTVQAITLTPTYKINEWLLARAEFGYEWASREGYESESGAFNKSSLPQLGAELIFKF